MSRSITTLGRGWSPVAVLAATPAVAVPFVGDDELLFVQDTDTVGERIIDDCVSDECVPSPASIALLGIGLIAALSSRARRRGA